MQDWWIRFILAGSQRAPGLLWDHAKFPPGFTFLIYDLIIILVARNVPFNRIICSVVCYLPVLDDHRLSSSRFIIRVVVELPTADDVWFRQKLNRNTGEHLGIHEEAPGVQYRDRRWECVGARETLTKLYIYSKVILLLPSGRQHCG